jgi:hypothetical protein
MGLHDGAGEGGEGRRGDDAVGKEFAGKRVADGDAEIAGALGAEGKVAKATEELTSR